MKALVFLSSFYLSNRSWYMFIRPYLDSKLTQIWENISFWSQNWWKFIYRKNSKNQHFQKKRDKRCEIHSNTCSFDHIWQKKLLNHRHIGKTTKKRQNKHVKQQKTNTLFFFIKPGNFCPILTRKLNFFSDLCQLWIKI